MNKSNGSEWFHADTYSASFWSADMPILFKDIEFSYKAWSWRDFFLLWPFYVACYLSIGFSSKVMQHMLL